MRVKTLLLLVVLVGGGYYAYTTVYGPVPTELPKTDPYTAGENYFTGGVFDKAIENFRTALSEKPDDPARAPKAMFEIGKSYEWDKNMVESKKAYEEFVAKYPNDPQAAEAKRLIEKFSLQGIK